MSKVTGIKSVDFKITAYGYGVVNWNGPTTLTGDNGQTVDNHTLPKLRGYTNLTGKVKEETGYKYKKQAADLDFKETPLYNVVPSSQCKRTSPLLLEDFIDQLGNGNFEQMGRSGTKEKELNKKGEESSNSFFSKTTFGDTQYIAYGSISIEQLEFISLDKKFDRAAMIVKDGEGEKIAQAVQVFIQSLDPNREPKAG